jgi:hypothetical protein
MRSAPVDWVTETNAYSKQALKLSATAGSVNHSFLKGVTASVPRRA